MNFRYFVIISSWKRQGPSFDQTRIPLTKWCFVPSLVEIGLVILLKIFIFLNFVNVFSLLASPNIWTNLNSLHTRMRCVNFVTVFLLFRYHLPLEKGGALQLNPLNPSASLVEIGSVVVEKTTHTDKLWSEKVTWTFGSGELKSKNRTQDHCRATSSHNHWATQSFKLQRCFS